MSPLFTELSRLALRYHDACQSPLSCPRDREILRTKLADLEEASKNLRTQAAQAVDLSGPEQTRLHQYLEQLRKVRAASHNCAAAPMEDRPPKHRTCIEDLEELTTYVRFLSEVLNHFNAKQRKEPAL